jgi:hypothetical protein
MKFDLQGKLHGAIIALIIVYVRTRVYHIHPAINMAMHVGAAPPGVHDVNKAAPVHLLSSSDLVPKPKSKTSKEPSLLILSEQESYRPNCKHVSDSGCRHHHIARFG